MSKALNYVAGTVITTGAIVGAVAYARRRRALPPAASDTPAAPGPAPAPASEPSPIPPIPPPHPSSLKPMTWEGLVPLPTPTEVNGDLSRNWGTTPAELRPLFLRVEEASGIAGAARILAIVAYRESRFTPNAHNGDESDEQGERSASWRAYHNNKDRNPPLMHGEAAANFGSGGLFGNLAPYALWTGVQEMKDKAPLLGSDPRILFIPRVAAFTAAVYLQRLLAHYEIRDHGDIKVGWGSISLLSESGRTNSSYTRIRDQFFEDAKTLGIDLGDVATIPSKMSAAAWPGVAKVFEQLVVKLPTPGKVVA